MLPLLAGYSACRRTHVAPKHQAGRIKQWLHYLRRHYAEAQTLYDGVHAPQCRRAGCSSAVHLSTNGGTIRRCPDTAFSSLP